jgi:hypothetical protein
LSRRSTSWRRFARRASDQQAEGGGRLTPARMLQVITRVGRTPVRQHTLQTPLGKIGSCHILRHIATHYSQRDRPPPYSGESAANLSFCRIESLSSLFSRTSGRDRRAPSGAYVRTNRLIQSRTLAQSFTGPHRVPNVRITSTAGIELEHRAAAVRS